MRMQLGSPSKIYRVNCGMTSKGLTDSRFRFKVARSSRTPLDTQTATASKMHVGNRPPAVSSAAVLWIAFTTLISGCTAELTVEAEHQMIVLPAPHTSEPYTITNIACFISQTPPNVRWITPNGTNVLTQAGQYTVSNGEIGLATGEMRYGSVLIIQDMSYENAGVYVCEAMMEDNCSSFPKFATIQLILKMQLTVTRGEVEVTYNKSVSESVELQCEASGYIRPDSDIRWFKNGQLIVEGEKYSIDFKDGRPNAAQTGSNETSPSRISTLTIDSIEESDSGTYRCQSLATGETASTNLYVELEQDPATTTIPTEVPPTLNPSQTPSPLTDPATTTIPTEVPPTSNPSQTPSPPSVMTRTGSSNCSVDVAAAVIATFILTAALAVVAGFVVACLWFKGRHSRKIKSGVSSPDLGSTAHATSHTNVSEQVDMYRISTGAEQDEMEGSSGDTPDSK